MRVLVLSHALGYALADIRLVMPLRTWADQHGGELRVGSLKYLRLHDIEWADVVVLQRSADKSSLRAAKLALAAGRRLIFEIDDLLTAVPTFLRDAADSAAQRPALITLLRSADRVTAPTRRLCEHLKVLGARTSLIPNYAWPLPVVQARHDDQAPTTLVLASSDTVQVDCLLEPLLSLQQRFGQQLKLLTIGPVHQGLSHTALRFQALPTTDRAGFLSIVSQQSNPVGLIPLDDSEFSACKSPIKYFDYAVAGAATICSAVLPYLEVVRHRSTGYLVANTTDAWLRAIETLTISVHRRAALVAQARTDVLAHHSLGHSVAAWQQTLSTLMPVDRTLRPAWSFTDNCRDRWLGAAHPLRQMNQRRRAQHRKRKDISAPLRRS